MVICDPAKIDDRCCKGAPDLIIEILSPSTARHDRIVKFQLYLKAGVRDYWIVDPDTKTIQAGIWENGRYSFAVYSDDGAVPVSVLPGLHINLSEVFTEV
jgi:Uma2 family endonuclease